MNIFLCYLQRSHLQDLKDVTHNIHYETYRVRRLNKSNMDFSELGLSTWLQENGTADKCESESHLWSLHQPPSARKTPEEYCWWWCSSFNQNKRFWFPILKKNRWRTFSVFSFSPFLIIGQTSELFLNDKLYWVTSRHKTFIRFGYIFECELIYWGGWGHTVGESRQQKKHEPPKYLSCLSGSLYGQKYVGSQGLISRSGSNVAVIAAVVSALHVQLSHMGGMYRCPQTYGNTVHHSCLKVKCV